MRCTRGCYLWVMIFCVCSTVGYYTMLSSPRIKRTRFELDHWSYSEQQSAVKVGSFDYRQDSARRTLLRNSNVQRYLLSLNYWEQHTMAMRNLYTLACFSTLWNMSVIQPFTYNSRLYGLPNFKPDDNRGASRRGEDLKLIFNTDFINNAFENNNFTRLTQFQTFLMNGHRRVTVVHFISRKEVHELSVMKGEAGTIIRKKFKHESIVNCIDILEKTRNLIESRLNDEVQRFSSNTPSPYPNFKIVKYFCVNMSIMHTPDQLASKVQLGNPDQNESVIFVNWRGTSAQTMLVTTAKGVHPNNRIAMDSICKTKKFSGEDNRGIIQHSQLVVRTAKRFLAEKGLNGVDYIAVHIRSEKLGLKEPRFPGSFKSCLEKLSETIDGLAATKNLSFVYITDFGEYGSDSCKNCRSGLRILKWIKQRGIKELKFDPTTMGFPADRGLAAAVEMNVLASAKYLIACGGGAFQSQVVNNFRAFTSNSNTDSSLYLVCTSNNTIPNIV